MAFTSDENLMVHENELKNMIPTVEAVNAQHKIFEINTHYWLSKILKSQIPYKKCGIHLKEKIKLSDCG